MPWTKEENILCHLLLKDKIFQNCLKIDATHLYDKDLLLWQETKKKKLHVLQVNIIKIIKKTTTLIWCLLLKRCIFYRKYSKWPPLCLSQVTNHNNINELHLFWAILYILLLTPHDLHFSATKNLMADLCSNLKHCVWFVAILNILKNKQKKEYTWYRWKFKTFAHKITF